MKYLGNLRCEQLELQPPFEKVENCFGWMGETIETGKLKNFFESRVTDYRKGAVIDDL
jgi:ribonucleoside-diphosphate reductase beta chain